MFNYNYNKKPGQVKTVTPAVTPAVTADNKMQAILNSLSPATRTTVRIVGKWLWTIPGIELNQAACSELEQAGFKYSQYRECYQHNCGNYRKGSSAFNKRASVDGIFGKYGVEEVKA